MEKVLASLIYCLLVLSLDVVQTGSTHFATKATENTSRNLKQVSVIPTSTNSEVLVTTVSDFTEGTTQYSSITTDNDKITSTAATAEKTSDFQTSPSTWTSLTDSASVKSTTPSTETPLFTTTHTIYTTLDMSVSPTENSFHTIFTTVNTANRTTQGLYLNESEKIMTIIFSVVLGVFLLALVMTTICKCRYKLQYMHQLLNITNEADGFVADNDTLVISGGLYDGHPIYDNVPPVPSEPSQFHLEFLQ